MLKRRPWKNFEMHHNHSPSLLSLYGHVFGHVIGSHSEDRLEIELAVNPGDEVSDVTVRLSANLMSCLSEGEPLIRISSLLSREAGRPVEISDVQISGATMNASRRLTSGSAEIRVDVLTPPDSTVTLNFKAWELAGPLDGEAPYLFATLATKISFPGLPGVPAVVTLVTSQGTAPRSTQGNYSLAYPSRTFQGHRYTNLYFQDSADIVLQYRCASMDSFKMPWQTIGKAAVASAFVYFISAMIPATRNSDLAERLLAVIGAFVTSAGTAWDFIQEITVFTIYDQRRNRISLLVLVSELSVLTTMVLTLIRLSEHSAAAALSALPMACLILTGVLVALAVGGFILHYLGWWQGFLCDCSGCENRLRIRHGRPECKYTGRVFCDSHIRTVCQTCRHGKDLISGRLDTVSLYRADMLPCSFSHDLTRLATRGQEGSSRANSEMDMVE
jgi:hypothetical protein